MTIQEAKKELGSIRNIYNKCVRQKAKLDELRSKFYSLSGIDFTKERVQGGGEDDWKFELLCKIDEIERGIAADILEMEKRTQAVQDKIYKLPFPYNEVLAKRYIDFKRYEEIAVEMLYSFSGVNSIIYRGIQMYAGKR